MSIQSELKAFLSRTRRRIWPIRLPVGLLEEAILELDYQSKARKANYERAEELQQKLTAADKVVSNLRCSFCAQPLTTPEHARPAIQGLQNAFICHECVKDCMMVVTTHEQNRG